MYNWWYRWWILLVSFIYYDFFFKASESSESSKSRKIMTDCSGHTGGAVPNRKIKAISNNYNEYSWCIRGKDISGVTIFWMKEYCFLNERIEVVLSLNFNVKNISKKYFNEGKILKNNSYIEFFYPSWVCSCTLSFKIRFGLALLKL